MRGTLCCNLILDPSKERKRRKKKKKKSMRAFISRPSVASPLPLETQCLSLSVGP